MIRSSILIFFSLLFLKPGYSQSSGYLWPTNASQHLTSTFGETRSAHFHSGLDIKTWGREGYKVFAAKDGYIYRLAISVKGYGKVIYLRHPDSTFTVYAHLQRFNDTLQSYIDSVRMTDYSFEIDLTVDSLQMQVKQGDVIGFTGSTGVGPPHLHFETRHADETPYNALRTNLRVEDSIPPVISSIMAVPLSEKTLIEGSHLPRVYYPDTQNYLTIPASGPLGISVNVYDGANGVTNKYAVYELLMLSGADTLFQERLDEFSFDEDDLMLNDRLTAFGDYRRTFQTLFKKDGPENPFYIKVDPTTVIIPGESTKDFRVIAKDYFGNESEVNIRAQLSSGHENLHSTSIAGAPIQNWYWTEDWAATGEGQTIDLRNYPSGRIWSDSLKQRIQFAGDTTFFIARFAPSDPYKFTTPDQILTVRFPSQSFFDTLTTVSYHSFHDDSPYINIQPGMIPARKDIMIQYYLGDHFKEGHHYRLYRLDRLRNRIRYVDSILRGKTVYGFPSDLGEFLILDDNDPPEVDEPRIVQTDYGKTLIYIYAFDSLSGIDYNNAEVVVNGEKGIVEFDNEEDLLIYYNPDFKPAKANTIEITVFDRAGNKTQRTYSK